ncbi:MAG: phospholipid carrier-dependent glycosyltransferase, partial [Cellvibrionales bacterium]|nr:phospholipid carrier-dependent glycosyltransferase [Cellvibrionales bacterium]
RYLISLQSPKAIFRGALKDKYKALLAAFVVATTGFLIKSSSVIATDMPVAVFTLLAVYFALRYRFEERHAFLRASLIFCGVAAATKYNSGLVVIVPYLAMRHLRTQAKTSLNIPKDHYVIVVPAMAFFLAMPGLVLNIIKFISNVVSEVLHYSVNGHKNYESSLGFDNFFHQMTQMNGHLGAVVFAIAVLGIFISRSENDKLKFLWVYPLAFVVFMSLMKTNFHRNFIQIYPFMAVFFVAGVSTIWEMITNYITKRSLQRMAQAGFVFALVAIIAHNGFKQLTQTTLALQNVYDSRSESMDFLQSSDKQTVIIAKELDIHASDLSKLDGRYQLVPLADIYLRLQQGGPATYPVIYVVPTKLSHFDGKYKHRISDDLRRQADDWRQFINNYPEEKIIQSFGKRNLSLSLFSVDPKLVIIE